jgi:hypothetical protein
MVDKKNLNTIKQLETFKYNVILKKLYKRIEEKEEIEIKLLLLKINKYIENIKNNNYNKQEISKLLLIIKNYNFKK